jgi:hypothetical protein
MSTELIDNRLNALTSWVVGGLCFILVFTISVVALMLWQTSRIASNGAQLRVVATQTHSSLCALRHDLSVRYESNAKLLREHSEDPIQVFGLAIPRRELVQSAHDQKATLDALADLKCE